MGPGVGEVRGHAGEGDDIDGGFDGTLESEEEGHPDQVETELEGVEGGTAFSQDEVSGGGERVGAGVARRG